MGGKLNAFFPFHFELISYRIVSSDEVPKLMIDMY